MDTQKIYAKKPSLNQVKRWGNSSTTENKVLRPILRAAAAKLIKSVDIDYYQCLNNEVMQIVLLQNKHPKFQKI